jgi:hypothetical protein
MQNSSSRSVQGDHNEHQYENKFEIVRPGCQFLAWIIWHICTCDVISAAKMNANFAAVKTSIDMLEAAKVVGFRVQHPIGLRCIDLDNTATNNKPDVVISVTDTRTAYEIAINRPEIELNYENTIKKWRVCTTGSTQSVPNIEYHIMVFNP